MQTLTDIRNLLAERGLRPRHRFGQNFLHDQNQIRRLITAASLQPDELVFEVGPGTGTLTEALLESGAEVIACEIDRELADLIEERLGDRLTLVRGDCLARGRMLNPEIVCAIAGRPFKLVANLPYQAASPLMSTLLIEHPNCVGQFVTIQKEVADRLLAKPSTKEYGPLGIIVQSFADVRRIATVSASCFWPQPKVTSAMVAIEPSAVSHQPSADHLDRIEDRRAFSRFVVDLFTKRRKQLGAIFGRDRTWPNRITPDQRPEALLPARVRMLWRAMTPGVSDEGEASGGSDP